MKTILEWLNELPQPYKSQAIYNFHAYIKYFAFIHPEKGELLNTKTYEYMCEAITHSSTWKDTAQGQDYWSKIYDEYEEIKIADLQKKKEEEMRKRITYSTSMLAMLEKISNSSNVAYRLTQHEYCDNTFANYVTMRGDMCSYLPAGREHKVNPDTNRWLRDGRQDMKPAKLARKLLNERGLEGFTDADFEKFNNVVRSYISIIGDEDGLGKNIKMEVIDGDDIKDAYYVENYSDIAGTGSNLWNSCMRYDSCQEYFGIYTQNKNKVSMLVALDCKRKVIGRAILWLFNDGTKGMDTIYAPDSIQPNFITWAIDNGYYYKSSQSCHHSRFDMFNGDDVTDVYKVCKLDKWEFKRYPYMDTMQYLGSDGKISNDCDKVNNYITLRCTGGGYEDDDQSTVTDINGERLDDDDARWIDYRRPDGARIEGYIHYEEATYCNDGNYYLDEDTICISGDCYFVGDDAVCETYDGDFQLRDDCVYLDAGSHQGEYALLDDAVSLSGSGEYALQKDCTELHDGEWALDDDCVLCEHTREYYLTEDTSTADDGSQVATEYLEEYNESIKELQND